MVEMNFTLSGGRIDRSMTAANWRGDDARANPNRFVAYISRTAILLTASIRAHCVRFIVPTSAHWRCCLESCPSPRTEHSPARGCSWRTWRPDGRGGAASLPCRGGTSPAWEVSRQPRAGLERAASVAVCESIRHPLRTWTATSRPKTTGTGVPMKSENPPNCPVTVSPEITSTTSGKGFGPSWQILFASSIHSRRRARSGSLAIASRRIRWVSSSVQVLDFVSTVTPPGRAYSATSALRLS